MKSNSLKFGIAAFLMTAGVAAVFAESKSPSSSPRILNVRLAGPPVTLDWNGQAGLGEAPIVVNLAEGLYGYEYPSNKLVPAIAASVEKSKDLKQYTFKIREDAKWSDGRPIYAQDFVNAWLKVLSPQSTSIYAYYLFDLENGEDYNNGKVTSADAVGVKATADRTLVVTLKRPNQSWETNTAFWPFFPTRNDLEKKFGTNLWRPGVLVSSGPFIFDSSEQGKKAVLKRNPYYTRAKTNVDEIDFYFVLDGAEAFKKFQEGFFPFLNNLPYTQMGTASKRPDYHEIPLYRHHVIALNTEKFPLSNKEFRLAVLSAIHPEDLLPKGVPSLKVAKTLIPPPFTGSKKPTSTAFDLTAAKEHLKKSGIVMSKNMSIRILTSISEPYLSIGKAVQKQLKEGLGLQTELAALQNQEYTAYMNLGDYNASIITWTAKVLSPQDFLFPYSARADHNRIKVGTTFYDQWIQEGVQATNPKIAEESFFKAQEFISQNEAALNPLFFETGAYLKGPKIKNLYFNHQGIPVLKDVVLEK